VTRSAAEPSNPEPVLRIRAAALTGNSTVGLFWTTSSPAALKLISTRGRLCQPIGQGSSLDRR
jgi:hypothetical protein